MNGGSLRLTLDVFSGRPNPAVVIEGREAAELLDRLVPVRRIEEDEAALPPESTLGYRGVVIEQLGMEPRSELPGRFRLGAGMLLGRGLAHRIADESFERELIGPDGPFRRLDVGPEFFERLRAEAIRVVDVTAKFPGVAVHFPWPWPRPCRCGPLYEPAWWNVPARQYDNNCYNYATNYRTDTFAQPGRAAGAMYADLSCPAVRAGAFADELIDAPDADNHCPPAGHLVALVVAPGWDFHWYRKGRNGWWSHKPGGTPVTDVDNSGAAILDPRTADRGPYTDFCGFMVVMHGHIKIA